MKYYDDDKMMCCGNYMHGPKYQEKCCDQEEYDGFDEECCMPKIKCKPVKECVKVYKCYYKLYKICHYRLYKLCPQCGHEYDFYTHRGMCPKCR